MMKAHADRAHFCSRRAASVAKTALSAIVVRQARKSDDRRRENQRQKSRKRKEERPDHRCKVKRANWVHFISLFARRTDVNP
mmetsp:Transcript_52486/g.122468  ORF Transcript_52486/g.122468 Transcript_52486/m.122468 type:complete len:82 (-) Transcript_52486:274-519(-)